MGLLHFREYDIKMDRATVAGIGELVRQAAAMVIKEKGYGPETLLLEICGGYRRGKDSNGRLVGGYMARGRVTSCRFVYVQGMPTSWSPVPKRAGRKG